ncbi:MAG TPA: ABC transporter permease [Saprospiraceae bacterium]|nr:ABC transporter permease [Saprospiraceae bacterium]
MRKVFGAFVVKEIKHILRDVQTLIILIGMPIVLVILFGFAVKNEVNDAKIAIIDMAKDDLSLELTHQLSASNYFILSELPGSTNQIENIFRKGDAKMAIVFEPDFANKFYKDKKASMQLIADASDPNTANILLNYAQAIIRNFQNEKNKNAHVPYLINMETKMLYNPTLKSVVYFVPGIMTIILMLISAMMTSITIAKEKEKGTMEILLASPLNPSLIVIGKVAPYIILALFNAATIIALGIWIFDMPLVGSFGLLTGEILLFILASLSLGVFISTISQTQQVAMMISLMGLLLPSILLSGFIFPLESMPKVLQAIANIIPAKWFIQILRGIMVKGVGIDFLWKQTIVLAGMTLFFIAVSIKKFKIRLE